MAVQLRGTNTAHKIRAASGYALACARWFHPDGQPIPAHPSTAMRFVLVSPAERLRVGSVAHSARELEDQVVWKPGEFRVHPPAVWPNERASWTFAIMGDVKDADRARAGSGAFALRIWCGNITGPTAGWELPAQHCVSVHWLEPVIGDSEVVFDRARPAAGVAVPTPQGVQFEPPLTPNGVPLSEPLVFHTHGIGHDVLSVAGQPGADTEFVMAAFTITVCCPAAEFATCVARAAAHGWQLSASPAPHMSSGFQFPHACLSLPVELEIVRQIDGILPPAHVLQPSPMLGPAAAGPASSPPLSPLVSPAAGLGSPVLARGLARPAFAAPELLLHTSTQLPLRVTVLPPLQALLAFEQVQAAIPQTTPDQAEAAQLLSSWQAGNKLPLAAMAPPSAWYFHTDFWQNPYAVAHYHGVPLWSEEHWACLRPHLASMADLGQRVITTTAVHDPWGSQTAVPYASMITWRLHGAMPTGDGPLRLSFDFTVWDQWVQHALAAGIGPWIHVYSALPWSADGGGSERTGSMPAKYTLWHADTRRWVTLWAHPLSALYKALWLPFLQALEQHVREVGLAGQVAVAVDERPPAEMAAALAVLRAAAPSLRASLAGCYHGSMLDAVDDWALWLHSPSGHERAFPPGVPLRRAEAAITQRAMQRRRPSQPEDHATFCMPVLSQATLSAERAGCVGHAHLRARIARPITLCYVCCGPSAPNTFAASPPLESWWLPLHAAAEGLDGVLRWAADSWPTSVDVDARFRSSTWRAGDTYMLYPGGVPSVRSEQFRAGICVAEKARWLRALLAALPLLLDTPPSPTSGCPLLRVESDVDMEAGLPVEHTPTIPEPDSDHCSSPTSPPAGPYAAVLAAARHAESALVQALSSCVFPCRPWSAALADTSDLPELYTRAESCLPSHHRGHGQYPVPSLPTLPHPDVLRVEHRVERAIAEGETVVLRLCLALQQSRAVVLGPLWA